MLVETQLAVRIDRLEDEGGLDHGRADPVRVNVGSGTTIFQVSLALDVDRSGNSDRGTSIYKGRKTTRESVPQNP